MKLVVNNHREVGDRQPFVILPRTLTEKTLGFLLGAADSLERNGEDACAQLLRQTAKELWENIQ